MKLWAKISTVLAALLMAMTLSACSPTATSEGTGGYFDDSVITTKVNFFRCYFHHTGDFHLNLMRPSFS